MHRIVVLLTLLLGGCASQAAFKSNVAVDEGPPPARLVALPDPLACVSGTLSAKDRLKTFTVGDFTDRSGKVNPTGSGDATGTFNTQGGESMLYSALGRTGVKTVVMTAASRQLTDWQIAKQGGGKLLTPDIIISGSITTTDFDPGDGAGISVGGVGASTFQNRILNSIDLQAYYAPTGDQPGGLQVASVTIVKQVVQDGQEIKVSRFVGGVNSTYVALNAGSYNREPLQFSTRAMLELGLSELMVQISKKGASCLPAPLPPKMVASAS